MLRGKRLNLTGHQDDLIRESSACIPTYQYIVDNYLIRNWKSGRSHVIWVGEEGLDPKSISDVQPPTSICRMC